MRIYKVLLLVVFGLFYSCKSNDLSTLNKGRNMDIYLLIGQSNMAGRATIEIQDRDSLNNVFLYTSGVSKVWEKATNPLNKYSTVRKKISMQKMGPGYEFAKAMVKARPNHKIGLVVNAKGGTSIEEWKPGDTLYNAAVNRVKKAMKYGVLRGVVWHQGESNSSKYKLYMPKIIELIAALRLDLNAPNLPFIAGQLSPDKPNRIHFNNMILELPNKVINTGVVTTKNTTTIDKTHFDSKSQRLLGQRYAEELLRLMK